jgi:hypothetical protein
LSVTLLDDLNILVDSRWVLVALVLVPTFYTLRLIATRHLLVKWCQHFGQASFETTFRQ